MNAHRLRTLIVWGRADHRNHAGARGERCHSGRVPQAPGPRTACSTRRRRRSAASTCRMEAVKALEAVVRLCIRGFATQDVASADATRREHRACARMPSAFCVQMWRRGHFCRRSLSRPPIERLTDFPRAGCFQVERVNCDGHLAV
jgi:hypothetical protein